MTPISRQQPLRRPRSRTHNRAERGQSLVEFAVVFPLFWTVLIALVEFSFGFQSVLAVSFASRNAAVIASEAGPAAMADCAVLRSIESDVTAPASAGQIQTVDIYWTDANGVVKAGATTTYTRSTSSTIPCVVNGTAFTAPYTRTADGYPMASRCSIRSGCAGHAGVDTVGVKITYIYPFHTPYGAVLGGTGWTLGRSSEMRMEPFQ
jgi:Flp pilus assembly protein TadG